MSSENEGTFQSNNIVSQLWIINQRCFQNLYLNLSLSRKFLLAFYDL